VVLLKGKAGQRSVEFSITVDSTQNVSPVDAAQPIHRLAAKAQIKQLEDGEKGTLLLLHIGVLCDFSWVVCLLSVTCLSCHGKYYYNMVI